ncbi:hypothetical protein AKJ51_01420 [candidate division MSBL1 archaeon SCGC-AAA382A20]|uniref:Uncharacterized protein n=1 Tax=candidate division MSBL1 archaeon SCGC-AAA382A20 TaxID=1698280 RepID=A0A133VLU3_9EURY|nr:hypothetical protein AKJ51_01420 [candidate division MSBL1 archaeon SCGC-AAA382A20]
MSWFKHSYEHALASKGVKTKMNAKESFQKPSFEELKNVAHNVADDILDKEYKCFYASEQIFKKLKELGYKPRMVRGIFHIPPPEWHDYDYEFNEEEYDRDHTWIEIEDEKGDEWIVDATVEQFLPWASREFEEIILEDEGGILITPTYDTKYDKYGK